MWFSSFLDLKPEKFSLSFCLLPPLSAYKLPPLTVAILSMLGLIASMLLVCLLSCLYKVHKRNKKNKKLVLLAQQAGKGEGEAFREVTPHGAVFFSHGLTFLRILLKISNNIQQRDSLFLFGKLNTVHLSITRLTLTRCHLKVVNTTNNNNNNIETTTHANANGT